MTYNNYIHITVMVSFGGPHCRNKVTHKHACINGLVGTVAIPGWYLPLMTEKISAFAADSH